jgi:hypothetical protein
VRAQTRVLRGKYQIGRSPPDQVRMWTRSESVLDIFTFLGTMKAMGSIEEP